MGARAGKWSGGYVRRTKSGKKVYIIEKWHHGDRIHVSTGCTTLEAARKELARFELDPRRYQPGGGHSAGALYLDTDLVLEYRAHQIAEGLSVGWVDDVGRCLSDWAEALEGRDLRALSLTLDLLPALEDVSQRANRIKAIRGLFKWMRAKGKVAREHDATLDLRVPQSQSNRPLEERAYPIEVVERFYAGLSSWEYVNGCRRGTTPRAGLEVTRVDLQPIRDIVVLRAKCGVHTTEIGRIAQGLGKIRELQGYGEIAGTLAFPHKRGDWHIVSVDAQALAAAKRLRAAGNIPNRVYTSRTLRRAAAALGMGGFALENLRHSFITWGAEYGSEVRPKDAGAPLAFVSQVAGHRSMRITKQRYVGVYVPPMLVLPIRLVHPEDPPLS